MKKLTSSILIMILLLIGAGAIYRSGHRANMDQVVARALSRHSDIDYIAKVTTTIDYNGKTISAQATVYHQGDDEKVEYASTCGKTVWSMTKGSQSYTYMPNEKKLLISETSALFSDADRSALLVKNYKSLSDGTDKVAGRPAYVIKLTSRYDGRRSKRLWIDKENLNVLKIIDYSASGEERSQTETKEINYGARIPSNTFDVPAQTVIKTTMVHKSIRTITVCESGRSMDLFSKLAFPVSLPAYMPNGYKLEGYHLFYSQCNCHHCSALLTYTDGLNVISIFQAPKTTCCTDGSCNMADCGKDGKGCAVADCDIAKTGQVTRGDKTIVVVGDLLPNEVKKIAESVK
jgi:outer membrane lipoprotein-sorting protein